MRYSRFRVDDLDGLKADLLATRDVVLRPDAAASISEPMKDDAQYVGVVALFRDSGKSGVWKLLIPRKQWKSMDPVKIVANDNVLELVGAQPEPVAAGAAAARRMRRRGAGRGRREGVTHQEPDAMAVQGTTEGRRRPRRRSCRHMAARCPTLGLVGRMKSYGNRLKTQFT